MHSSLAIHLIVLVPPGVVFGAGNTAATLAGFISVPATGYLLQVRGQGLNVGRAERTGGMAGAGVEAAISLGASEEGRRYLLPNVQELAQLWLGGGGGGGSGLPGSARRCPFPLGTVPHTLSRTPHPLQTTNSWPLVFGITAAHYLVGAVFWALWVGDRPLPEDDLGMEPQQSKLSG